MGVSEAEVKVFVVKSLQEVISSPGVSSWARVIMSGIWEWGASLRGYSLKLMYVLCLWLYGIIMRQRHFCNLKATLYQKA